MRYSLPNGYYKLVSSLGVPCKKLSETDSTGIIEMEVPYWVYFIGECGYDEQGYGDGLWLATIFDKSYFDKIPGWNQVHITDQYWLIAIAWIIAENPWLALEIDSVLQLGGGEGLRVLFEERLGITESLFD